jgi:hypothetical protein
MTPLRATDLQLFLISAEAAIRHQSGVDGRVRLAAKRMFTALQAPSTQAVPQASRLPVCRHLDRALENARHQPGSVAALADAFAIIEPRLSWKVRDGAESEQFRDGHANATITGPGGLRYGAMSGSV